MSRSRAAKKNSQISYLEEDRGVPRSSSFNTSIETKAFIKPATTNQRLFVRAIKDSDITIAYGPAGTGKTLTAIHTAVCLLNSEASPIERIIYVRSNVDSDDEDAIGHLPGSELEKIKPLAYPLLDNLIQFMAKGTAEYLIDSGKIEVLTMSMLRGRSFPSSFIILDEAENCTPRGIKTLLTRMGDSSKVVIIGDPDQQDRRRLENGLSDLVHRVEPYIGRLIDDYYLISMIKFGIEDVVRNGIIKTILKLYPEQG